MCPHVTRCHVSSPHQAAWCPLKGRVPEGVQQAPLALPRNAQWARPNSPANPQA